jgi:Tol biopolymer transport system component
MFGCAITIASTWEHQKHLYDDYQYRLSLSLSPQLQTAPISDDGKVRYVAMLNDGYAVRDTSIQSPLYRNAGDDELSFTSAPGQVMVEKTARSSNILDQARQSVTTSNAYNPVLSKDAATLAFLRDSNGRGILWLKNLRTGVETSSLSPHDLNVLDVAFVPNGTVVIAASSGGTPQIFGLSNGQQWLRLTNGADRYPAISPDGHWLAFSRSNGRAWNLWLRNLTTEVEQRLSDADCNQLTATWEPDSKSLLYASDCGRGLFLTALARRRVVP